MILAIDSGNTNVVFTLVQEGDAVVSWRRAVNDRRTADEDGIWLLQLMKRHGVKPRQISGVIISSVRPAALFGLRQLAAQRGNLFAQLGHICACFHLSLQRIR